MCLLNTELPSTVGGERTVEDLEEDEMEEAEENYGSEGEELRHGAPEYASSDEDMVRVIREKANREIKKLKQKSWVRNNVIIYVHSLLLLISNHHRSNNQPFVNAEK